MNQIRGENATSKYAPVENISAPPKKKSAPDEKILNTPLAKHHLE